MIEHQGLLPTQESNVSLEPPAPLILYAGCPVPFTRICVRGLRRSPLRGVVTQRFERAPWRSWNEFDVVAAAIRAKGKARRPARCSCVEGV